MKSTTFRSQEERNARLKKKKESLIKKIHQLTILCDLKACLICFNSEDNKIEAWPSPGEAESLIDKFYSLSEVDRIKKSDDQESLIKKNTEKIEKKLADSRRVIDGIEMDLLMAELHNGHKQVGDLTPSQIEKLKVFSEKKMQGLRREMSSKEHPNKKPDLVDERMKGSAFASGWGGMDCSRPMESRGSVGYDWSAFDEQNVENPRDEDKESADDDSDDHMEASDDDSHRYRKADLVDEPKKGLAFDWGMMNGFQTSNNFSQSLCREMSSKGHPYTKPELVDERKKGLAFASDWGVMNCSRPMESGVKTVGLNDYNWFVSDEQNVDKPLEEDKAASNDVSHRYTKPDPVAEPTRGLAFAPDWGMMNGIKPMESRGSVNFNDYKWLGFNEPKGEKPLDEDKESSDDDSHRYTKQDLVDEPTKGSAFASDWGMMSGLKPMESRGSGYINWFPFDEPTVEKPLDNHMESADDDSHPYTKPELVDERTKGLAFDWGMMDGFKTMESRGSGYLNDYKWPVFDEPQVDKPRDDEDMESSDDDSDDLESSDDDNAGII